MPRLYKRTGKLRVLMLSCEKKKYWEKTITAIYLMCCYLLLGWTKHFHQIYHCERWILDFFSFSFSFLHFWPLIFCIFCISLIISFCRRAPFFIFLCDQTQAHTHHKGKFQSKKKNKRFLSLPRLKTAYARVIDFVFEQSLCFYLSLECSTWLDFKFNWEFVIIPFDSCDCDSIVDSFYGMIKSNDKCVYL